MPPRNKPVVPFKNSQRLLILGYIIIGLALLAPLAACTGQDTPAPEQPTETPTEQSVAEEPAAPTEKAPPPQIEVVEGAKVTKDTTPGQINVEYSVFLSPNSGDGSVIASVRIPEMLASLNTVQVEKVTIPEDAAPIVGAQESYEASIYIAPRMRIEMEAPSLLNIDGPTELFQNVAIDRIDEPTFWLWTFKAPPDIGYHNFTLSVYLNEETDPVWVRIFQIEVRDPATPTPSPTCTCTPTATSTSTPAPTPTPTPVPFMSTSSGMATMVGVVVLVVLLVGLMIVNLRRGGDTSMLSQSGQRRNLQKQITIHTRRLQLLKERQAQQGINTDPATIMEIETIEKELEKLCHRIPPEFDKMKKVSE